MSFVVVAAAARFGFVACFILASVSGSHCVFLLRHFFLLHRSVGDHFAYHKGEAPAVSVKAYTVRSTKPGR